MADLSEADTAHTHPNIPTSRRNVLGALGLASVVVPVAALAGPYAPVDAEFWALHREYKRIEVAWNEDPDDSEENFERQGDIAHEAFSVMMACPVHTSSAVLEKLTITDWSEVSLAVEPYCSIAAITADLQRMAKREH